MTRAVSVTIPEQYQEVAQNDEKWWDDKEVLETLYEEEGYSIRQIGALVGVPGATLRNRLVEYGIERRDRLDALRRAFSGHVSLAEVNVPDARNSSKALRWVDTYKGETTSVAVHHLLAVAEGADPHEIFGETPGVNVEVRMKNGWRSDVRPDNIEVVRQEAPWRDREKMIEGLLEYGSHHALADAWGCSTGTISDWKEKHDLQYQNDPRRQQDHEQDQEPAESAA